MNAILVVAYSSVSGRELVSDELCACECSHMITTCLSAVLERCQELHVNVAWGYLREIPMQVWGNGKHAWAMESMRTVAMAMVWNLSYKQINASNQFLQIDLSLIHIW